MTARLTEMQQAQFALRDALRRTAPKVHAELARDGSINATRLRLGVSFYVEEMIADEQLAQAWNQLDVFAHVARQRLHELQDAAFEGTGLQARLDEAVAEEQQKAAQAKERVLDELLGALGWLINDPADKERVRDELTKRHEAAINERQAAADAARHAREMQL